MAVVIESSATDVAPSASKLLSARNAAELALQKIGAFTVNDSAADANEIERALEWMELEVAELTEVHKPTWLVPETLLFSLDADEASFDLADKVGAAYPTLGVARVISASIVDSNDYYTPINLKRRSDYEAQTDKTTGGTPEFIYVDRQNDRPQVYLYPVPGDDTLYLSLVVQTYARSVLGDLSLLEAGGVAHGFARGWQKWLVCATAAQIGDGPVRQLGAKKLSDIRGEAAASLTLLLRTQNQENVSLRMRRTRRYGD